MRLTVLKSNVPINDVQVNTPDTNEGYEIFVGRAEDCHVIIDDPLISRHHFVLKNEGTSWYCEKLSNLGIVSLNGVMATHTKISGGDEIKCGAYSIFVNDLPVLKPVQEEEPLLVQPIHAQPIYTPTPEPVVHKVPEPLAVEEELVVADDLDEEPHEEPLTLDDESEDNFSPSNDFNETNDDPVLESLSEFHIDSSPEYESEEESGAMMESNEDDGEEKTSFFKAFVNYQLVLFGEHAPYDRYQIDKDEIFIGRDPKKCDIVLNDPEVSTVHAVLRKTNVDITLEDLNSSNGTILNAERINKANIVAGDEFVIGSTSFTLEVKSDLLDAESDRLMPVESGQVIEREVIHEEEVPADEITQAGFESGVIQEKSILKRIWKDPVKRKKAIYALVLATMAYVFLVPDEPEEVSTESSPETKVSPTPAADTKPKLQLSKELEERRNVAYELGVSFFEQNKYFEALKEFQTVAEIDPNYKKIQTYLEQTKLGLKRIEELEAERRAEEERIKTKKIIEELLVKAREAVKEKQVQVAENIFAQITEKDPENIEVQQLKMELEAWQREQERVALEKAAKEAARKAMVDALQPGKTYYLKKEWYRAILKLEEFLRRKGTDEDLVKEGSDMLADARTQLASELGPLLGKARSLKEGQDLKNAYEAFLEVLKVEPTNAEALNEVDEIKSQLEARSKKIYREAIIAESLSLFTDAKEKFQEVQQISPTDSEYYKKASEKLKNYLE